jgi:hypothetical protein
MSDFELLTKIAALICVGVVMGGASWLNLYLYRRGKR